MDGYKAVAYVLGIGLLAGVLVNAQHTKLTPEEQAQQAAARKEQDKAVAAAPTVAHAAETKPATPAPTIAKVADIGRWEVSHERSLIDDSQNVHLYRKADEPIKPGLKLWPVYPELFIACRENRTSLYIDWKVYLGIDARPITYRIDSEPAQTPHWNISTNYEALGLWNGGQSIPFIKRLFQKDTLFAKVTPYGDNAASTTFDIAGLSEAIKPLREACRW